MALQFTPPSPRLLQEAYIPPSPSLDLYPTFPSQIWPPALSPVGESEPPPPPPSPVGGSEPPPPPPSPVGGSEPPPPPSPLQPPPSPGKPPVGLIAGLSVAGAGIVVAAIFIFWCYSRRKRRTRETFDLNSKEHFDGEPPLLQISPVGGPSASGGSPHKLQNNRPPDDVKVAMNPIPSHPAGFMSSYPPPLVRNGSGSEKPPPPPQSPGIVLGLSQSAFTYEDLAQATDNFSPANLLGEGGFGYVHKGVLPNGKTVAIKQLKAKSGQGDREFQAEVEVIGRIHHKNLVSLVGYCTSGARRMLVYEFVPNNTIEFHLHRAERPAMNWPTRMKIALGSAKGLTYLHEDCQPKIIHRDIKAANILLDHAFEAKVADFGLAKFFSDIDTHVSTRILGTFGYLAPEYASSGKLTEKSDVFSFGVVLLELITGHRPINKIHSFADGSLVEWARPLLMQALDEGNFNGLVDPRLENGYNYSEVTRMVACAAACVRHSARFRPRMSQILRALEGVIPLQDLNEGIKPGLGSQDHNANQYSEDLKVFSKLVLGSQEHGISECSGPSTDSIGRLHTSTSTNSESRQTTEEIEPI